MPTSSELFSASVAARQLGVPTARLRQLAATYEAAFGPLPRDARRSRLWPALALDHLRAALHLAAEGRAPSLEAACAAVAHVTNDEVPSLARETGAAPAAPGELTPDVYGAVLGLTEQVARLAREVSDLRELVGLQAQELRDLRKELRMYKQDEVARKALALVDHEHLSISSAPHATLEFPAWWRRLLRRR